MTVDNTQDEEDGKKVKDYGDIFSTDSKAKQNTMADAINAYRKKEMNKTDSLELENTQPSMFSCTY